MDLQNFENGDTESSKHQSKLLSLVFISNRLSKTSGITYVVK